MIARYLDEFALGVVLALGLGVAASRGCVVHAQAHRPGDALLLARLCVSEAGWECWQTGDGAAIYHVLRTRSSARRQTWRTAARSYAPHVSGQLAPRTVRGRWVAALREDGEQPAGWPARASWSAYRERWESVLAEARRVVVEGVASPCAERVEHWGGVVDRERARRLGLVRVDCGETRNDFYARGRR